MIMLNTLPWFWQALSFLSHWGVKETGELGWRTGSSPVLFWGESTGRRSQRQLTCCPLTSCPIPGISSAGEPASLLNLNVLENWNDCQVAHLRCLHAPGRGNLAGGETQSPLQPRPREGHGTPSEKSTLPREATSAPAPDIWALTFRRRRSFPGQRQARSYPGLQS